MGGSGGGGGSPDYVGAARETGQQNIALLNEQTRQNRPTQIGPGGRIDWTQGADGTWTQTNTLDPTKQYQFDTSNSLLSTYLNSALWDSQNRDLSKYSAMADATTRDKAEKALMDRLNPQLDRSEAALSSKLAAQGLTQGSEAWNNAYDSFNRQKNDAQLAAIIQGGTEQTNELNNITRQYELANALKNSNLNSYLTMLGGGQIQSPQFGNFTNAGAASAPDLTSALGLQQQSQQGAANAKTSQMQGILGGIGTIGGSYFGPVGGMAGGALGGLLGGLF